MSFIPPTISSISSISSNSIPQPIQPQLNQPQFNQPQPIQPIQPLNTSSIFTNADSIQKTISIPTQSTQSHSIQPKSKPSTTRRVQKPKPSICKVQITESFDTTQDVYNQFQNIISNSQKLYPYNTEELISPYEGECPLAKNLLCHPQSSTNLLFFDSTLLSVKLTEFKDEPKRIYQVSLADLKKYYDTNPKAMLTFKSHYKITPQTIYAKSVNYYNSLANTYQTYQNQIAQNPSLEPQYSAQMKKMLDSINYLTKEIEKLQTSISKEKDNVSVIYNTANYPITDKGGKWLTISYLIPYLMFASPRFINHTSNLLTDLLIATSYNSKIGTNEMHEPIYLNNYLSNLKNYKYNQSQFVDPKFKPHVSETPVSISQKSQNPNTSKSIHKLIIQTPKPIIPRIDDSLKNDANATTSYNAYINQNSISSISSGNLQTIQSFYTQLSKSISKLLNPADVLCLAAFNRLKTLNGQISIIKVDDSQVDAQGNITDLALLKKLKGIKEKTIKNKDAEGKVIESKIESQEMYNYKEFTISPKATLQNIHKYAASIGEIKMTDEELAKIKTKVEGDENKFNWIISITQLQDSNVSGVVKPGFDTFINSQKKSSTSKSGNRRKAPTAMKGADIGFIATENENVEFTNEESENFDYIENGEFANAENEDLYLNENVEAVDTVEETI